MIPHLPAYISITFGLTALATLLFFYWSVRNARAETGRRRATLILLGLIGWLVVQALLSLNGLYSIASMPPRIVLLGVLPAMVTIILLMTTTGGKQFVDSLPLANLTWLNTLRIPVEVVLYWLFLHKAVPELMTFEGRNYDILSGLTAPFIAYFGFTKGNVSRRLLLGWNLICLGLLLNIVTIAFLSTPTPLQQFAFEQPNIAIAYFPFSWLPTFVVPVVLFGHLTSIRQLLKSA